MIENESLNFLTRFYSQLWLIQGYAYLSLKKYGLLNLEPTEIETRQIY